MKKIASLFIIILIGVAIDAGAKEKLRKFYLTLGVFDGNETLTACAKGYHMASIWEILDTSNLSYNTDLGVIADDSGSGPPTGIQGWVRTGSLTSDSFANCKAWTSDSTFPDNTFGTLVNLDTSLGAIPATNISPWVAEGQGCEVTQPVWCVQD